MNRAETRAQVMIVAAEASSALFAQRLLEHWKKSKTSVRAFGVGSKAMEDLGFERFGKSEEMAVVGAAEVISHYSHLKSVFNRLVQEATERRPQVVIVMDYPDFNLMLAKKMKKIGIPVVYYISPQVWAWRKSRVYKIRDLCQEVFVLFPFEKDFYESHQVPVTFVGHPILDELEARHFDQEAVLVRRRRYGIADDEMVVGLMPGSRNSEIHQHLDIHLEVGRFLHRKYPKTKFVLMVAPTRTKEEFQDRLENLSYPLILMKDDPNDMISLCNVVLAASGTATLMVALLEKPMVIMYRLKWMTALLARLLVHGVKFFGLPNVIAGREIVPERWQDGATADKLAGLVERYLVDSDYYKSTQAELRLLKSELGSSGATARVAAALEKYWVVK